MNSVTQRETENVKLYHQYCTSARRAMNLRLWKYARNTLNKALGLLPSLGIDASEKLPCNSSLRHVFVYLSDLEYMLARDAENSGLQERAIEHYKNSLGFIQRLVPKNSKDELWYFEKTGDIYYSLKIFDKALENYSQVVKYRKMLRPSKRASFTYMKMGVACQQLGKFEDAENNYDLAIGSAASIGLRELEANLYYALASLLFYNLNRFEEVIKYCDKAIELTKDKETAASALELKAGASRSKGAYLDALKLNEEARHLLSISGVNSQTRVLHSTAEDLSYKGRHEEAIMILRRLLDLHIGLHDKAETLYQIATEYRELSDYETALTTLDQARQIASDIEDPCFVARCLNLQGEIYLLHIGSLEKSAMCYEQALNQFFSPGKKATDQSLKVYALLGLSSTYLNERNFYKAEAYASDILNVCDLNFPNSSNMKAMAYQKLSEIYLEQKEENWYTKVKENMMKALDSAGLKSLEAPMLIFMSECSLEAKEYEDSLSYIYKAIEIYYNFENGGQDGILMCLNALLHIYFAIGRIRNAKRILEGELSKVNAKAVDPTLLACCYTGLAYANRKLEDEHQVILNLTKAVDILDSLRSKLFSIDLKIDFQRHAVEPYEQLIESFFFLEDVKQTFEYMEKSKSRALIEQIRTTRLRKPQSISELLGKSEDLLIDNINEAIAKNQKGETLYEKERELKQIWTTMAQTQPASVELMEYLSMRRGDYLNANQFINLLKDIDNVAIVEYYVLNEKLLIFFTSSDKRNLQIYSKVIDKKILKKYCDYMISFIENNKAIGINQVNNASSNRFSEISLYLLEPIADTLSRNEHIHIIPHSFLHSIPIHALPVNGEPLIDRHTVSYSPSATVLKYCLARSPRKMENALAIGTTSSDLVFAEIETKEISTLLNCKADIGRYVNKEYIKSNIEGRDIISFSCHARFDSATALNSAIILPSQEKLTARELFQLKISADLVSLSACESGKSEIKSGDEMIGLVRSIIFAGAKSVMASLYRVNDLVAYLTMRKFYYGICEERLNKSQSLRVTQRYLKEVRARDIIKILAGLTEDAGVLQKDVRIGLERLLEYFGTLEPKAKCFEHIYYWSPFMIFGDWQ